MKIENNKLGENEAVIMDLNPSKFEKDKDHLFFDFFSMYTKNIIKNTGE